MQNLHKLVWFLIGPKLSFGDFRCMNIEHMNMLETRNKCPALIEYNIEVFISSYEYVYLYEYVYAFYLYNIILKFSVGSIV